MIYSYCSLCEFVENKFITNVKPEQIQGASIDLTLGDHIKNEDGISTILKDGETYNLRPNEFILACTEQVFYLPKWLCAIYYMNSSMARIGLQHALATFCDPAWHGSALTLELKNQTQRKVIPLKKGDRIGQVVFYKLDQPVPDEFSYAKRGRYNNDLSTMGVKEK